MISAEAPIVFAKACEMFILELTLRSWRFTEENKRRTLQRSDVAQVNLPCRSLLLPVTPPTDTLGCCLLRQRHAAVAEFVHFA